MLLRRALLLCVAVPALAAPPAPLPAKRVSELFIVELNDPNVPGSCAYLGEAVLNLALVEAARLYSAGVTMMTHNEPPGGRGGPPARPEAARTLYGQFRIGPEHEAYLHLIKQRYQETLNWVLNGGPVAVSDKGPSLPQSVRPYLYCNHDWIEFRTVNDVHLDRNRQQVPVQDPHTGAIRGQLIGELAGVERHVQDEVNRQRRRGVVIDRLDVSVLRDVPTGDYIGFDYIRWQDRHDPNKGFCQGDMAGLTGWVELTRPRGPILTICRGGWTPWDPYPASKNVPFTYQRVGERVPRPIFEDQVIIGPRAAGEVDYLENQVPSCLNLAHELMHLVLGRSRTTIGDGTGGGGVPEIYAPSECMALEPHNSQSNVNNYLWAALAYDATLRMDRVDGFPVEFGAGYATLKRPGPEEFDLP